MATVDVSQRRLDFGAVQHCGRREETEVLLDYVRRQGDRPASIWIEAEPGVGKSHLLDQFRESITSDNQDGSAEEDDADATKRGSCICIQGKFEERAAASEPFQAISEAMAELVEVLLRDATSSTGPSWSESIQQALDTEWSLLVDILPVLKTLVEHDKLNTSYAARIAEEAGEDSSDSHQEDHDEDDAFGNFSTKEWRFERFRFAFRALIRHICHRLKEASQQLILVLDDMHWVDTDSLQIIKTFLQDTRRPSNFLLVVATRPVGEEQYEQLYDFRETLLQLRHDKPLVKILPVTRLSVPEIKDVLLELLEVQDKDKDEAQQKATELAQIIKAKTQGNFFVVTQFLRLLERARHIYYQDNEWQFNLAAIAKMNPISENVSEVVARNLVQTVQGRRRSALMVAASFGVSKFDVSTIVHAVSVLEEHTTSGDESGDDEDEDENSYILTNEDDDPYVVSQRMNDMSMDLDKAACEGFVEITSPGHYRFAHDRIRESAYSLLPPGDSRKQVHLKVGRQLRSWMDTSSELGLWHAGQGFSKESLLLHAAKQSNLGSDLIQDEWELLELAELNFMAAELAARKAAFFSSMEYLQVGLSHLGSTPEQAWENHYDLALKFTVALTRMQYSCGLITECWATSEAVIQHGKSFPDKSKMYHTRLLCLMQQERHKEALELTLQVFDMLGKPWPRRNVMLHAFREYMKVRRFLKSTTDEAIVNLPIHEDENLVLYVDFMEKMVEIAWLRGELGYLLLYCCRSVGLLAEGNNYHRSFIAMSVWGSLQTNFGDFQAGYRYGQLAKLIGEKQRKSHPQLIPRLDLARCCFINIWQQELCFLGDLRIVENAFRQYWVHGMVEEALMDASSLFQHMLLAGASLERICNVCDQFSEAFVDYKQMMHWYINAPIYQAVLNLQQTADDNNPALLLGSHLTKSESSFQETCQKTSNKPATFQYQFWSMYLAYHFGDYRRAKSYLKSMRGDLFEDGAGVLVSNRLFYTGLVYFALYKETRKVRYHRRAVRAQRKLEAWWKKNVTICGYMSKLLQAENLSCRRRSKIDPVLLAYDQAIQSVAEAGLSAHHALAQELAGAFLVNCKASSTSTLIMAKQYLSFALTLYQEWGAVAKVEDLQHRYGSVGLEDGASVIKPLSSLKKVPSRMHPSSGHEESETLEGSYMLDSSSLRSSGLRSSSVRGSSLRGSSARGHRLSGR